MSGGTPYTVGGLLLPVGYEQLATCFVVPQLPYQP